MSSHRSSERIEAAWEKWKQKHVGEPRHAVFYPGFLAGAEAAAAEYAPLVAAARAMLNQTDCDCDSEYRHKEYGEPPWAAPYHASDCPVFVCWIPHETALRAALEQVEGATNPNRERA